MKSIKLINRQTGSLIALVALVLAVVAPTIASAAQLTARSVELSSSSINATGVSYNIGFTSAGAAGGAVIDFCSNSPLIGAECTAPTGFSASAATSTFGSVDAVDANTLKVTGTIAASSAVSVPLAGLTNPASVGPLYVRIVTYATSGDLANYTDAEELGNGTVDEGGAAINITNTIGVSAAVLESMTFCVSGAEIEKDCAVDLTKPPVLKLGETTGSVTALSASNVSTGDIFTQISTNAVTGAVVSLKSSAIGCGGLIRAGAPTSCDILPALATGITAGQAKFGVKTNAATDSVGATAAGSYVPANLSAYNNSDYALTYAAGDASGVTSPYGSAFLDTAGAPVNNKNVKLTFGASISNNTPAGLYSVDLGLIATGKF
jgi:hypothetical protein